MTVGGELGGAASSLTRTQSRSSATPPAGSQPIVETKTRRFACQTASVARPSTADSIVEGTPGWAGAGTSASNGAISPAPTSPRVIVVVALGRPVIRNQATSAFAVAWIPTPNTVADVAGDWRAGRHAKYSFGKSAGAM